MAIAEYSLSCTRGGKKTISFHALYISIKNELKDAVETSVIPYQSISYVFEEHVTSDGEGLRKMNIHLICGAIHTISSNDAQQSEEILIHLLKNTLVQSKVATVRAN